MRKAPLIMLMDEERTVLTRWARGRSTPARLVERARMVLAAADGQRNKDIAVALGVSPNKVGRWRTRFAQARLAGIERDAPRPGRDPVLRRELAPRITEATTRTRPPNATHWSVRTLARHLGVDRNMVHRVWRAAGLKPHLVRHFKVSNDPQFVEKLRDVVGLYLNPPEHALVLCADEKSQIQALDRTQKSLPLYPGRCGTLTHDYMRHGTTSLFAALSLLEGRVIGTCMARHRHQEWIKFLRLVNEQTAPELDLHFILDNYQTHKHRKVKEWLSRHPRFHMHFIPTSSSWLNLVERWFRDLTDKSIRRGVFRSVEELTHTIADYIAHNNRDPHPFVWTAKADDILEKVRRAKAALENLQSD